MMQTFLAYPEMRRNARILDNRRLGKQRVEAIQIAKALLGLYDGWRNHPATRMWEGYEPFLIKIYLRSVMSTWDDYRLTCFHGIREGLDSHDCSECQSIARELGYDMSNGKTYIFTKPPKKRKKKKL